MKKILFMFVLTLTAFLLAFNVKAADMTDLITVTDNMGNITTVTKEYDATDDFNEITVKLELTRDVIDDILDQTPGTGSTLGMFYFTLNPGITLPTGQEVMKQNYYFKNDVPFATSKAKVNELLDDDDEGSTSPTVWISGVNIKYYDGEKFVKLSTPGDGTKSIQKGLTDQLNCTNDELVYGENYNFFMYTDLYWLYAWEKEDNTREYIKVSYIIDFPVMGTKNGVTTNFFDLDDALDAGETDVVITDDLVLNDAITIPEGTIVEVRGGSLTLGENGSITNNGTFIGSYINADNEEVHSINVTENTGGTTTFSSSTAEENDKVTINNKLNKNYKVKSLRILNDFTDEDVTSLLTLSEDKTSFTMPDYPVRFVYDYELINPNTGDKLSSSIILGTISIMGLIICSIYFNKKKTSD